MTKPLVSNNVDLRSFPYMPLEVERLFNSDLVGISSGDEFRAAVLLWCASWHQVPAASLPNDDRILALKAGFGRDLQSWGKVKPTAMRGFILCSDGRFYHPVVAENALKAWELKRSNADKTRAATEARKVKLNGHENRDGQRHVGRNEDQLEIEREKEREKEKEKKESINARADARDSFLANARRTIRDLESPDGKWLLKGEEIEKWKPDYPSIVVKNHVNAAMKYFVSILGKSEKETRALIPSWLAKREDAAREKKETTLRKEVNDAKKKTEPLYRGVRP